MIARLWVRAIVASLPAPVRERYREEWEAELAGAREVGVSGATVVIGAASTAIHLDRADPRVTGLPRRAELLRRLRWLGAFAASAVVLAIGAYGLGSFGDYGAAAPPDAELVAVLAGVTGALAVVSAVAGLFAILASGRAALGILPPKAAFARGAVLGAALLVWLATSVLLPVLGIGVFLMLTVGFGFVIVASAGTGGTDAAPRGSRALLAAGVTLAGLAVIAGGLLHILVWNPLARVPGLELAEIYRRLAAAGEGGGHVMAIAWAVFWGLALLAYLALCLTARGGVRRWLDLRRVLVLGLLVVGATAFFSWWAGFGMGMSIADAFGTSGGDAAASGPMLVLIWQLCTVMALLLSASAPVARSAPLQGEARQSSLAPEA